VFEVMMGLDWMVCMGGDGGVHMLARCAHHLAVDRSIGADD
jgi:hypothetical protein